MPPTKPATAALASISGVSWPFSYSMGTEPITEATLLWVATPPTVWVRNAATRSRAVSSSFSATPPSNRGPPILAMIPPSPANASPVSSPPSTAAAVLPPSHVSRLPSANCQSWVPPSSPTMNAMLSSSSLAIVLTFSLAIEQAGPMDRNEAPPVAGPNA